MSGELSLPPSFGDYLRRFRRSKQMSQKLFAELLGIDPVKLSTIESGNFILHLGAAIDIAQQLGIDEKTAIECCIQDQLVTAFVNYTVSIVPKRPSFLNPRIN